MAVGVMSLTGAFAGDINFRNYSQTSAGDLADADNYHWGSVTRGEFASSTVWADINVSSIPVWLSSDISVSTLYYGEGNNNTMTLDLRDQGGVSHTLTVLNDFRPVADGNVLKLVSGTVNAGHVHVVDYLNAKIIVSGEQARLNMTANTCWLGISVNGAEVRAENGGVFDMDANGTANNEYVIQNGGSLVAGPSGVVTNANRVNIWGGNNGRILVDGGKMFASKGFKDGSYTGQGSSVTVKNGGLLDLGTGGLVWKGGSLSNSVVQVEGTGSVLVARASGIAVAEAACSNLFLAANGAKIIATNGVNGQIAWGNGNNATRPCARNYFILDNAYLNLSNNSFRLSDNHGSNNFFIARNKATASMLAFIFGGNYGHNHGVVTSGATVTLDATENFSLWFTGVGNTFEVSDGATVRSTQRPILFKGDYSELTIDAGTLSTPLALEATTLKEAKLTVRNGGKIQCGGLGIGHQGACPVGTTPITVTLDDGEIYVTDTTFYFGNYGSAMTEPVLNLKGRSRIRSKEGVNCYMNYRGDLIVNWYLPENGYDLPAGEGVIHNPSDQIDFNGVKAMNFDADALLKFGRNGGGKVLLAKGTAVVVSNEKLAAWNEALAAIHPRVRLDHSSNDKLYLTVPYLGGMSIMVK